MLGFVQSCSAIAQAPHNDAALILRLPKSLLESIDATIATLRDENPLCLELGLLTRSSFTRLCLRYVLDQLDTEYVGLHATGDING